MGDKVFRSRLEGMKKEKKEKKEKKKKKKELRKKKKKKSKKKKLKKAGATESHRHKARNAAPGFPIPAGDQLFHPSFRCIYVNEIECVYRNLSFNLKKKREFFVRN